MQRAMILSVVVPTALAVVLLGVSHVLWRRRAPASIGRWSLGLASAIGLWSAFVVVKTWPKLPPGDAVEWTLWLAAAAALFGAVDAARPLPAAARWGGRAALSFALPWLVLRPLVEHAFEGAQAALWVGGSGAVLLGIWASLDALAPRLRGPSLPLALTLLGTAAATAIGLTGTALFAQALGGATAALGAMAALGVLRRDLDLSRAVAPVATLALGGFALGAHHYGGLPLTALLGLAVLPFALWAVAAPLRGRSVWIQAAAAGALALAVGGASVYAGVAPRSDDGGGGAAGADGYAPSDGGEDDGGGYDEDYGYD